MTSLGQPIDENFIDHVVAWPKRFPIPMGWVEATELSEKFLKSVPNSATNPGATGGVETVTLSIAQMASHSHQSTGIAHNHKIPVTSIANAGGQLMYKGGNGGLPEDPGFSENVMVIDPVQLQGGDGPHNNIPAFCEVIWIKKPL